MLVCTEGAVKDIRLSIHWSRQGSFYLIYLFIYFFRAAPAAYEVPKLGAESELQLLAYTTATATPGPSHVCDLHHSSQQCWILNPLSEARD